MKQALTLMASWLALAAMSPQTDSDSIWSKYGDQLTAEGITKPMSRQAMLWVELQYHLGICHRYISAEDRTYWRLWWKDTPLERSAMGKALLKAGDDQYYQGLQDMLRKPLTAAHCQRIANNWLTQMKKAAAEP